MPSIASDGIHVKDVTEDSIRTARTYRAAHESARYVARPAPSAEDGPGLGRNVSIEHVHRQSVTNAVSQTRATGTRPSHRLASHVKSGHRRRYEPPYQAGLIMLPRMTSPADARARSSSRALTWTLGYRLGSVALQRCADLRNEDAAGTCGLSPGCSPHTTWRESASGQGTSWDAGNIRDGHDRGRRAPHRLRTRRRGTAARPPPRLRGGRPDDMAAADRRALGRVHGRGLGRAGRRSIIRSAGVVRHGRLRRLPGRIHRRGSVWKGRTWPGCRSVARSRSRSPAATRPSRGR